MRFTDEARRFRFARRHGLHPDHRLPAVVDVTRAMVALHATEPPTVHLALAARTDLRVSDVEDALYRDRTLVKQLAMRRTLFGFDREFLPAVLGSASTRVAAQQYAQLTKDLERHGIAADGADWIARGRQAVLDRLADGSMLSAKALREDLPELAGRTTVGPDARTWDVPQSFAPRLLTLLGAEGLIMRGENEGHWRTSRPRWVLTERWLGARPEQFAPADGYRELVRAWLARFGPGTENDLVWWLGATKSVVRAALAELDAVGVELDRGETGFVLPGDEHADTEPVPDWAALLPVLDPTLMGWKERDFYLDPVHVPYLFDSNGNGGTTAWWNGRVVGCWVQDVDARVQVLPIGPLAADAVDALQVEADRLTAFLDGVVISSVYKSRQMKGEKLP